MQVLLGTCYAIRRRAKYLNICKGGLFGQVWPGVGGFGRVWALEVLHIIGRLCNKGCLSKTVVMDARQSKSKDCVKLALASYLIMVYFVCEACNEVRRLRSLETDSLVDSRYCR